MHTDRDLSGANAIVAAAQARGVPVISAEQLLDWTEGRNNTSFAGLSFDGSRLRFTLNPAAGARGLEAMVPAATAAGRLSGLTRNGPRRDQLARGQGDRVPRLRRRPGRLRGHVSARERRRLARRAHAAGRRTRQDKLAPRVRVRPRRVRASRGGLIKLRVSCPRSERFCRVDLRLRRADTTVARKKFRVAGGKTRRVSLRLKRAARRALSRLELDARQGSGSGSRRGRQPGHDAHPDPAARPEAEMTLEGLARTQRTTSPDGQGVGLMKRLLMATVAMLVAVAWAGAATAAAQTQEDTDFSGGTHAGTAMAAAGRPRAQSRLRRRRGLRRDGAAGRLADGRPWACRRNRDRRRRDAHRQRGAGEHDDVLRRRSLARLRCHVHGGRVPARRLRSRRSTDPPWAMFSTGGGTLPVGLYARTAAPGGPTENTPIAGVDPLVEHDYSIEWTPTEVRYFVDGDLVATHADRDNCADCDPSQVTSTWAAEAWRSSTSTSTRIRPRARSLRVSSTPATAAPPGAR